GRRAPRIRGGPKSNRRSHRRERPDARGEGKRDHPGLETRKVVAARMTAIERKAIEVAPGGGGALPAHVAIIMDGNGRWAAARGLPRFEGHRRGVEAVRRAVRAAGELGIRYLTLFSFSSENWTRP